MILNYNEPKHQTQERSGTRRPGNPASLPWSLETVKWSQNQQGGNGGRKKGKIDVVVKNKRKNGNNFSCKKCRK